MPPQTETENHFLRSLSASSVELLLQDAVRVDLVAKQILQSAGEVPRFIYFPEGGIISFTLALPSSGNAEFGIVGREGICCFSGVKATQPSPVVAVVQVGGSMAYRIEAAHLRAVAARHPDVQSAVVSTLYGFMTQMAITAISNARHPLGARLARWLLMCDDRLDRRDVPLTHEFMALMLGSQRTSVTAALHVIEGEGAIRSQRGLVQIRDRARLERIAGEAYYAP